MDSTVCDTTTLATLAKAAAQGAGATLENYSRFLYAFPSNACTWWGLGSVGGNPSQAWVNGDMALEVARVLPPRADILDVGCGNGFIAHHLQGMLGTTVVGLDVGANTAARINYLPYDGRHFPVRDHSFDAVLLCYVLHHAQDPRLVLNEVNRVLRDGGLAIIYEDIPSIWWDRMVCWTHDRQWRGRTAGARHRDRLRVRRDQRRPGTSER